MMKRSKEIIGMPVISIAGGVQIGKIKELLINSQQKTVEFLLLDKQETGDEVKGIPFNYAEGVGEYAVTVKNENVPLEIYRIAILKDLIEKGINIISTKVITRKGKYLGDAGEYSIDTESGALKEVYYQTDQEAEMIMPIERVITLGKEMLVVEEATPQPEEAPAPNDSKTNFNGGDEESSATKLAEQPAENILTEDAGQVEREMLTTHPSDDSDPTDIFIQKQKQFLIGKTLLKDFSSKEGEIIAWENEVITEELFEKAYKLGVQKVMELAMSVQN